MTQSFWFTEYFCFGVQYDQNIYIYIKSLQVQIHLNTWTRAQDMQALGCLNSQQAGAELGQAKLKLELELCFTSSEICWIELVDYINWVDQYHQTLTSNDWDNAKNIE